MPEPAYDRGIMRCAVVLIALAGLACASGGDRPKDAAHIDVRQLVGPSPVQSLG